MKRLGFSLVELVVSLGVLGLLMVAMASSLALASRALPTADGAPAATVATARALQQLQEDLAMAVDLPIRQSQRVTMNLPDRDGDGLPEVITYKWTGVAGSALTRKINGGEAAVVLDRVDDFTLTYVAETRAETLPGPETEQPEQLFASYTGASSLKDFSVDYENWIGYRLTPSLPASASSWRLTRTLVVASPRGSTDGITAFDLSHWTGSAPTAEPVDSSTFAESAIPGDNQWIEVPFTGNARFAAGETAAITLRHVGEGNHSGNFKFDESASGSANAHETSDAGGSWTAYTSGTSMQHYTYGRYAVTGADWTFTHRHVKQVKIKLTATSAPGVSQQSLVRLHNRPAMTAAAWRTDLGADPTGVDLNHDGANDWIDAGGAFGSGRLADGEWLLQAGPVASPSSYIFLNPSVLDAWLSDGEADGLSGGVEWRINRQAGGCSALRVTVGLSGNTQTVSVLASRSDGSWQVWSTRTRPADAVVHVRLLASPNTGRVAVQLDGETLGTIALTVRSDGGGPSVGFTADGGSSGVRLHRLSVFAIDPELGR